MLGKPMRFAAVCILVFAIGGEANRDKGAPGSKAVVTSSCSKYRRLAVIPLLSSVVTSPATAFAPILGNNPLTGTHDMLRMVSSDDIKSFANRRIEKAGVTSPVSEAFFFELAMLEPPTPADVEAFRSLNKHKESRPRFTDSMETPPFNVLKENTGCVGDVAEKLHLTPEEEAALFSWDHGDHAIINEIARGADEVHFMDYNAWESTERDIQCTLTKQDMLPWLKIFNAGLNKMPSADAVRLYRGVGFNAEGTSGDAPITGFASFSEDFNVAKSMAEDKRKDGVQPTIFVMDKHSSGRSFEQMDFPMDRKEVVFRVGTKFVIKENQLVKQEVEALWRENLASGTSYDGFNTIQGNSRISAMGELVINMAIPDFKVLVVEEVPSDDA